MERAESYVDCVFCRIVEGKAPAKELMRWNNAIAIEPLNPVVPGHVLIIPTVHVTDFADDPLVSALVMARAASMAAWYPQFQECNLITSRGESATQSVFHLHVHLVPRAEGDGLHLPWTGQL